jgi:hypothetical protein
MMSRAEGLPSTEVKVGMRVSARVIDNSGAGLTMQDIWHHTISGLRSRAGQAGRQQRQDQHRYQAT